MGCVQSKRASRDERREVGEADRQRELEELSNALRNVVNGRKDGMEVGRGAEGEKVTRAGDSPAKERQRPRQEPYLTAQRGWPSWLSDALGDAIQDWTPRCANTFEKLDKIGQGTYSNVYKARDLITGKIVALKKVRFDNLGPESVKFMGREILVLRKLNHPNVIKFEGLVTSRMSCSLYLVFEYMEHDLAGLVGHGSYLATNQGRKFTEPQVKCFMKQLLSGLEHCHNHGVLHRDIKGSNLLINNEGILKIADFGLATFFDPDRRQPMTSRVVTLWYRPPELLLGATYYGVGVDLWSAGCILAELLAGKPIMPGRTEVEQVHKIFKLCGSPSEEYWKKSKLPHATIFKPQQPYNRCVAETFKDFPISSLPLIETLFSIDPDERGTATSALNSEFFTTEPYACEPSSLPKCPPTKEIDVIKLREEARRQRGVSGKANVVDGNRRARARDRGGRAVPAPEANAEIQANLDKRRVVNPANSESKSEKFPPPHQDGAVGFPHTSYNGPVSFGAADTSFGSSFFGLRPSAFVRKTGPSKRKGSSRAEQPQTAAPSRRFLRPIKTSSTTLSMNPNSKGKESVSEVFGSQKVK